MKRNTERTALTESAMLAEFERGFIFSPLEVRLRNDLRERAGGRTADAVLEVLWNSERAQFIAEFKSRSTPLVFQAAVQQVKRHAQESSRLPMIVLPYLRSKQLDELQQMQVSGIDLSGNGIVMVPNRLLVYRTGYSNKFPEPKTTKYAYRGATSLVGRVFLCRSEYESLSDIENELRKRGASVAISTVSKALKRMEEDVIIAREPGRIRLLQPEKLLQQLSESYRPPKIRRTVACSTQEPIGDLLAETSPNVKVVMNGRSSIDAYAIMGRDESPVLYTDNLDRLLGNWGERVKPTARFVDLDLWETDDQTVYFDIRIRRGLPYASPIQVFLECASGDKREKETAEQVQNVVLRELYDGEGGAAE